MVMTLEKTKLLDIILVVHSFIHLLYSKMVDLQSSMQEKICSFNWLMTAACTALRIYFHGRRRVTITSKLTKGIPTHMANLQNFIATFRS